MNLYSDLLLDEAKNPRNKKKLTNCDFSFTARNAGCGDIVTLELKFDPSTDKVIQVGWSGDGCVISQASMSLLSDLLKGKTKKELADIDLEIILEKMHTPNLSLGRVRCASLGLQALEELSKK